MTATAREAGSAPGFHEAGAFWAKLGWVNFGGPAGQIAIMHRELVERRGWIAEGDFLRALNFCMILPGPEAQQLATYIGWRLHGLRGGLVAGACFVIPSVFVLVGLSWLAAAHGGDPLVAGLLYGVQPPVVALVAEAVLRLGRRTLAHVVLVLFALGALVALQVLRLPFPLVVIGAALAGAALPRLGLGTQPAGEDAAGPSAPGRGGHPARLTAMGRAARLVAVFLTLWAAPVGALWAWRGPLDVLVQEALFFTQAAFVTFGGAYAVLAYVAEVAVDRYGWLDAAQMVHGLALAESTPGPLIMVNQYVGFLGAWKYHGDQPQLLYATVGALTTTYVTFLPSFLFIFLGAPYIEDLARRRALSAALVGVTAAVVGVIAHLGLLLGGKVLLAEDGRPDGFAIASALAALAMLRRTRVPAPYVIAAGAIAGLLWRTLGVV